MARPELVRIAFLISACLCACGLPVLYVRHTIELTERHGQELAHVIAEFEQAQYSDEVRQNPERLLEMATSEYVRQYRTEGAPLDLGYAGRFWVPITTTVEDACVLEYAPAGSVVRAQVKWRRDGQIERDLATYQLVWVTGSWKVASIRDMTPFGEGQADIFQLEEEWGVQCLIHRMRR